ncbi:MAG: hypothetical protein JXA54_13855 [Candidatus Heimdallarchaeota archaeon]|nr:hypothetical protein [Candidatus Heimdallarchaeota archaeon]
MSEKLIKELEDFLSPYVQQRFDYSNTPFGGLAKSLMSGRVNQIQQYVIWIMRALIRCILSTEKDIYLRDIVSVSTAEAYTMMQFTPMRNMHTYNASQGASYFDLIMEAEIHNWLLHLEEHEKLPGTYNRFSGLYKGGI